MSDSHDSHPAYLVIFWILCVFTALSWAADELISDLVSMQVLAVIVLAIATAKALCVMLYFMHLKFERNWKYVLLAPTFILACGLPLALLPDIGVHYYEVDVPQNSIADRVSMTPEETKSSGETAVPH